MIEKILEVKQLDVEVPGSLLIQQLSFSTYSGALLCITGDNGVGKTTLINYLLKAARDKNSYQSEIHLHIKFDDIQLVPQFRDIDAEYPLSVKDFVVLNLTHPLTP